MIREFLHKNNNSVLFTESNSDIDLLKTEWDKLNIIELKHYFDNGMLPENSEEFWSKILHFKDSSGCAVFSNIAKFALRALSLPFSNAFVERAFSFMNAIKTKARNKISIEILMAIMRIRIRFAQTECCNKFVPTTKMYELFTSQMYGQLEQISTARAVHTSGSNTDNENQDDVNFYGDLELFQEEELIA